MNSQQDTSRTASAKGTEPRSAQQAGNASSAPAQQRQSSPDAGSGEQRSRQPGEAPDAMPGRQYQGSGVMNKSGRFGSSQGPEDLGGSAGPDGGDSGRKA
jgi:hypothetical protein